MRACIVSLFLLLAATGSWGILIHPFLLGQPPQFFYTPPHGNIGQEQFLYSPHLRNPVAGPYQAFNYFQPDRNAYTYYNAPAVTRYPYYPNYRDSYSPVIQYIYQQAPVQPVQTHLEYGEKVPAPTLKNCDDGIKVQVEPEVVNRQPEGIAMEKVFKGPTMASLSEQPAEITMEQMFEGPNLASMSEQPRETADDKMSEEASATLMSAQSMESGDQRLSEEDLRPTMQLPIEKQETETVQKQEAMVVVVESAEMPMADAMSMENSPAESTTVAQ